MRHYTAVVHREHEVTVEYKDGVVIHRPLAALWPEHKPLAEVLKLKATTPPLIWEGTYQGNPTPAGGYTFRREWWSGKNRYQAGDRSLLTQVIGRYQGWDIAAKDKESNDPSACVTADILADYRMLIREVYVERLTFDVVPETILSLARRWNGDGLLRNVLIEDASSGTPAYQTLTATAEAWLRPLLFAMRPVGSKVERAGAASVWCANGMVLLPHPGPDVAWLLDFEDELFSFPQAAHDDQVDAFAYIVAFCENLLSAGYNARSAKGGG